jgi:hypothetical protein
VFTYGDRVRCACARPLTLRWKPKAYPRFAPYLVAGLLAAALPDLAQAHHGVAAVSVAGPEGPGAALETSSPLPLPQGTLFLMEKSEYVPFLRLESGPQKDFSLFNMVALGYGIRPWLSVYLFQPFNVKSDTGDGRNSGLGDPNLMLSLGFKYDEGFRLVPEKESLDELLDWHFSVWAASTLPLGSTEHRTAAGEPFAPDMQTGFGSLSSSVGLVVGKQLSSDLTWLSEINYQYFFAHTYPFTRYQFGGESRLSTALVYRAWGRGQTRLDLAGEMNGLLLQRDKEQDEAGAMERLSASGGAIVYAAFGLRLTHGPFGASLGIRRAIAKDLNEAAQQQGSEGLERFRAAITLSYSTRL